MNTYEFACVICPGLSVCLSSLKQKSRNMYIYAGRVRSWCCSRGMASRLDWSIRANNCISARCQTDRRTDAKSMFYALRCGRASIIVDVTWTKRRFYVYIPLKTTFKCNSVEVESGLTVPSSSGKTAPDQRTSLEPVIIFGRRVRY